MSILSMITNAFRTSLDDLRKAESAAEAAQQEAERAWANDPTDALRKKMIAADERLADTRRLVRQRELADAEAAKRAADEARTVKRRELDEHLALAEQTRAKLEAKVAKILPLAAQAAKIEEEANADVAAHRQALHAARALARELGEEREIADFGWSFRVMVTRALGEEQHRTGENRDVAHLFKAEPPDLPSDLVSKVA